MLLPGFLWLSSVSLLTASPGTQKRIIGGRNAEIHEAPWQVSLQKRGEHECGGSIYSKTIIITAAHCLEIIDYIELFEIRAGSSKFNSGGTVIKLAAFKYHKEWKKWKAGNDVGIIKLKKPLAFTRDIQPIPLAKKDPEVGSQVLATGWGESLTSEGPIHLQLVYIQINKKRLCKFKPHILHNGEICASVMGKSTCYGDSGGPLVANGTLVGIVSRGDVNCLGYEVLTSVAYYREWILNAIQTI